jgi:hypothetical protein
MSLVCSMHSTSAHLTNRHQFIYYIPNVIIQIITLYFVVHKALYVQFITTATADAVASAQSLRITRKLWKAGLMQNNPESYFLPHIDDEEKGCQPSEIQSPVLESGKAVSL